MQARLCWMGFLVLCTLLVLGGCAHLPNQAEIPGSGKLPIDGTWQLLSAPGIRLIAKVERGRMYIESLDAPYQDPSHYMYRPLNASDIGGVLIKDIQATASSQEYTGQCTGMADAAVGYKACTIVVIPQGLTTRFGVFGKVALEDEAWFWATYKGESFASAPAAPPPVSPHGIPTAAVVLPPPSGAPSTSTPPRPRRALVMGNAAYAEAPLRNPLNDAQALADLLRRLGVEVLLYQNADKPTMEQAVDRFTRGVPRGSAGLFFFSGHGVQIDGINYLVPIGARLEAASDVKYHAVAADWVLARMDESGMDVKLLFLDACRNNPLGRGWTRALSRGLAVMETSQGALIAYATSPGKTASDGTGRNSPFTAQLLRELGTPGRDIEVALKAVRAGVQQLTKGEQIPWVASSMTGNFSLAQ